MQWVLHIGTQKTGSKAIQQYLADSARLPASICFPLAGREGNLHHPLFEQLLKGNISNLLTATAEVADSGAAYGVISCEHLYVLPKASIELLFQVLGPARIAVFIREQSELIESMHNQLVKAHRVNYQRVHEYEKNITCYDANFDHMATIERWGGVFGFDYVTPIVYDKRDDAVAKFLGVLKIDKSTCIDARNAVNPNPALNFEALKILRYLKQHHANDDTLPNLVSIAHRMLKDYFVDTYRESNYSIISDATKVAVRTLYRDSNDQLRRLYFPQLDTLFREAQRAGIDVTDESVDMAVVESILNEAASFSQ
jgi:hypothetical protein